MTERPLRAIVDTSAIVRFARGGTRSVGVGETIAEINEEHASLLTEHEAAVLLGTPDDWQALAAALEIVGRWDTAVAALLAIDGDVCLLSTTPARYAGFGDADFVVEV